jgi:GH15 family glucan-1,4-alpha-glucosidase
MFIPQIADNGNTKTHGEVGMQNLNYGIIGNCNAGALISEHASVDWLCLPQFDSPSVFARILDEQKGGRFEILPAKPHKISQAYVKETNILRTTFSCDDGEFEVHDFMPRYIIDGDERYAPPDLIRYFRLNCGAPSFCIRYDPQLQYAGGHTQHTATAHHIKSFTSVGEYDSIYLYTGFNKNALLDGQVITLHEDNYCLLSYHQKLLQQSTWRSYLKLQRTKVYWMDWSERTTGYTRYQDIINRSALVLKALTSQKSGAVLAALTTSLPETIGEVRNWDYRFCWIRDASMVVKIMKQLGHDSVVRKYLNFIINIMPAKDEKIQIMYGINGEKDLTEFELDHLAGYEGSRPVRIGNAAYEQKQNDIYGILIDVIYENFRIHNTTLTYSEELWTIVRSVVRVVEQNWNQPDRGIWELRNEPRHFTFSKVLCWTAMDRAVKIARLLNQDSYAATWMILKDAIAADINQKAWSEKKQAFTQAYGSEDLDASVLLMESYGFIDGMDPRYISTVDAIQGELEHKGLMFRYRNSDDFGTPKSAFTICSFWLIKALIVSGRKEEAERKFQELLQYANHLGLFSEDIDFESGRLLGNFPQAYSHLALIETAIMLAGGKRTAEENLLHILH